MATRARIRHELKCWPEFFQPTLNGIKRFELRRDDREGGFQVGDELLLQEWIPPGRPVFPGSDERLKADPKGPGYYTGREVLVRVDYLMSAEQFDTLLLGGPDTGLSPAFVIMSISLI